MFKRFNLKIFTAWLIGVAAIFPACLEAGDHSLPYRANDVQTEQIRQVFLLNGGWRYAGSNMSPAQALSSDVNKGESVTLPHSWNAFDATDNDPGYRRDGGWYFKELDVPAAGAGKVWRLYFEGINISCRVYVNGIAAGGHVGGYLGFYVDITPHLKFGQINMLQVYVTNEINPDIIPSQKSDFFIYGGIIRDVWLQVLPKAFLDHSVISTPVVNADSARTQVEINLFNSNKETVSGRITATIQDNTGNIRSRIEMGEKSLQPGKNSFTVMFPPIERPDLWSPTEPNLYQLKTQWTSRDGRDQITDLFGYRWFEFKDGGAFYLNGKRLLLRGTHRHEEHAGYGAAMPDSLHRRDMWMIKKMGANFVRLAHYPQDPEVYRACDELGLLVWDELPWCRGGMGKEEWKNNTRRLLREQIEQNYNHPSIILWSLGNELDWLPDYKGGDNRDSLRAFLSELNELAHRLDPTRLTSLRKYYDGADIVDVFSPSIWAGWYSGVYKTYEKAIRSARKKYKRFFHAEYGAASHVGRHTENPVTGEGVIKADEWDEKQNLVKVKNIAGQGGWDENYAVDLFDWHLMVSETLPDFSGNAQWAFKDFGTPLRPENPIPYINQKGLVDRAGRFKDAWYVFKSYWTKSPQFCYIESHTWRERYGLPGESKEICVYSNCSRVELIVNDRSLGVKKRDILDFPAAGFHWSTTLQEGVNHLLAIGFRDDGEVTRDTMSVNYFTTMNLKAQGIELSVRRLDTNRLLVMARVVDKNGRTCLDYNKRVYFDANGGGRLLKYMGTPDGSDVIEFANGRAAIVFIPEAGKEAVIEARTQDFKGSYLRISG